MQNANNSYGATSDIKVKENIVDATSKLDDLMKVKIRHFNRIGESTKQIGVIAQELYDVLPEVVDVPQNPEHPMTVRYSEITALLINAVKELDDKLNLIDEKISNI